MRMMGHWLPRAVLAVTAAAAYTLVDLWLDCREAGSEACVWGKAYLPLSLALNVVLIGGAVFVIMTLLARYSRRAEPPADHGT